MADYQWLVQDKMLRRNADGAGIPWPPNESEGFAAQEWIAAGNVPDPPPPPPVAADEANYDNLPRTQRAILAMIGHYLGKTEAELKTDYHHFYTDHTH